MFSNCIYPADAIIADSHKTDDANRGSIEPPVHGMKDSSISSPFRPG